MSAEFGDRMGKPPDRGKSPGEGSPERDEHQAQPALEGPGFVSGPRPFAGAEPAIDPAAEPEGGGGGRKPPHLHPVGSPEPPDEGPPPTTREDAEIERQRVETDTIRAQNEAIRSGTAIKEKDAESEIFTAENRAEVEDEAIEVETETTRRERIFFMWVVALGIVITVVSSIIAGLIGQLLFFTGGGVGLLATGGGLRRLGVLTSPERRKTCVLARKGREDQGGGGTG